EVWRLGAGDVEVPETVQGIIAARLDALPPAEKSLAQAASVVGKVFWLGTVSQLADVPVWEAEELLHALERKELIRRERRASVAGETEYAFRHVLVRDVAYSQIPRARRSGLHAAAASWIESLGAERAEDGRDARTPSRGGGRVRPGRGGRGGDRVRGGDLAARRPRWLVPSFRTGGIRRRAAARVPREGVRRGSGGAFLRARRAHEGRARTRRGSDRDGRRGRRRRVGRRPSQHPGSSTLQRRRRRGRHRRPRTQSRARAQGQLPVPDPRVSQSRLRPVRQSRRAREGRVAYSRRPRPRRTHGSCPVSTLVSRESCR